MTYYDVTGPRPDLQERRGNVVEIKAGENPARTGATREAPFEGIGPVYHGAFVQGVVNAHQGVEQYPQRDYGPEPTRRPGEFYDTHSPHPVFPERGQQIVTATDAGQAEGRTWLGSGRAIPAWTSEDAYLAQFTEGTVPSHGVYEMQPSGQGGRRRNEAEVTRGRP